MPAAPVRSPLCDGRSHQTLARSTSHAAPARVGGSRRRLRLVLDRAGSAGLRQCCARRRRKCRQRTAQTSGSFFLRAFPTIPTPTCTTTTSLRRGGQIRRCRVRARAGKFDSQNYIEQNLASKLFYAQLPFANGGNSGQRTGGKLVLPPIVQNARRQGVCAHNPYVRSGFHTLLHPHAFQIGKFQFDAKLLEPPRRCLSDLSRDLANQK